IRARRLSRVRTPGKEAARRIDCGASRSTGIEAEREGLRRRVSIRGAGVQEQQLSLDDNLVSDTAHYRRRVCGREKVGVARSGRGQGEERSGSVGESALADVRALRTERYEVNDRSVCCEDAHGVSSFGQIEAHMQIRPVRAVLPGLVVRPDQKISV